MKCSIVDPRRCNNFAIQFLVYEWQRKKYAYCHRHKVNIDIIRWNNSGDYFKVFSSEHEADAYLAMIEVFAS